MQLANFKGITVRQSEVNRLKMELDGKKVSFSEGVTAEEWQQYYNVNLERYNPEIHKILVDGKPADFAVVNANKPSKEWITIDFMMTVEPTAIQGINQYLMDTRPKKQREAWRNLHKQVLDHLGKADIVPLDLRNLYIENIIRLMSFVLSLSKEQQKKMVFIIG